MRIQKLAVGVIIGTTMGAGVSRGTPLVADVGHRPRMRPRGRSPGDDLVPVPADRDEDDHRSMLRPTRCGHGSCRWASAGRAGTATTRLTTAARASSGSCPSGSPIAVGDVMPHSPGGGFAVSVVEPGQALVLSFDTELLESQRRR